MSISMVRCFGPIALTARGSHAMPLGNSSSLGTLLPRGAQGRSELCWEQTRSAWPLQAVKANMGSCVGQRATCLLATARPGCMTCTLGGRLRPPGSARLRREMAPESYRG